MPSGSDEAPGAVSASDPDTPSTPSAASANSIGILHDIAAALEPDGPISVGTMFRSPGLRTGGKIVAFLGGDDRLIVKFPRDRAAALVADGAAEPVTMGKRTMREWVVIAAHPAPEDTLSTWTALAREAFRYVLTT